MGWSKQLGNAELGLHHNSPFLASNMGLRRFKNTTDLNGMCQIEFMAVIAVYLLIGRFLCLQQGLLASL